MPTMKPHIVYMHQVRNVNEVSALGEFCWCTYLFVTLSATVGLNGWAMVSEVSAAGRIKDRNRARD